MNPAPSKHAIAGLMTAVGLSLAACSPGSPNTSQADSPAPVPKATAKALEIDAPAGAYKVDLNHADLSFSVSHLGLAPYVARFQQYEASLNLQPDNIDQSSIQISVDPMSITTGFVADYKATHKDSKFDSWEDDLARGDRFLMADEHPEVSFRSSQVSKTSDGKLKIDGELTLRGQTHPLSLIAEVSGSLAQHPFSKKGAIGFIAEGSFKRSRYGMNFMQGPGLLGDEVTVRFVGEFHQQQS